MITYGFFNAVNDDRKYNAEDIAKYFDKIIGNGVFANPSSSLQVSAHEGMKVKVAPGRGWIDCHYINNDADEILSVDESDMVLDRIDQIVMRLDRREEARNMSIVVKKGTPAQTPIVPILQRDDEIKEYALANVFIPSKSVSVAGSQISDTRMDKNVCGYVTSLIDQVDTTTLYQQIQADLKEFREVNQREFEEWVSELRDILDEEAAGKLMNLIELHAEDMENPHQLTKAQLGLSNVDNTSDANKPISVATQTALNGKLNLTGGTVSGATNFTGALTQTGRNVLNMEGNGGNVYAGNSQAAGTTNFTGTLQNAGRTVLTTNTAGTVYQGTVSNPKVNFTGTLQKNGYDVWTTKSKVLNFGTYFSQLVGEDPSTGYIKKTGNIVEIYFSGYSKITLAKQAYEFLTQTKLPSDFCPSMAIVRTTGTTFTQSTGFINTIRIDVLKDGNVRIANPTAIAGSSTLHADTNVFHFCLRYTTDTWV